MSNTIILSLRRKMLCIAAAAVVSIGFTACSDEMYETQNTTAPADGYKVSIPANIGSGSTRAIAYNSETGGYDATFETGDEVFAYYKTNEYTINSRNPLKPDANGKSANLVGELAFYRINWETHSEVQITPAVNDNLILLYKSPNFNYSKDFCNEYEKEADYAIATVTINSIESGLITTTAAAFENLQSIFKFNFTGIGSGVKIKKVMIQSEQNKLVNSYNVNGNSMNPDQKDNFGTVDYTYKDSGTDQHELTFLLRFASNPGDKITFTVVGSDGHRYSGSKSVTNSLENGKFYQAEIAMTDLGLAMTIMNTTTNEPLEVNSWIYLKSKEAAYTIANTGSNTTMNWYGGTNQLTFKGLSLTNTSQVIEATTDMNDVENTKEHHLILDGTNTLTSESGTAIMVGENCTLDISGSSTDKLTLKGTNNIQLGNNAKMIIKGGEVIVEGMVGSMPNSSIIISGNGDQTGQMRIKTPDNPYDYPPVKAGSGYVLQTATEGDYTVYTVTAADPYEQPKALSSATSADLGKIIGSDGNIHVLNWDLPNGISPVAMIASISSTGHGLAVAMDNVKKTNEWGTPMEYFTWDNSGMYNQSKTAEEIFNDWVNNNSVTFGTWYIPTKANLQTMIVDCGIEGDATAAHEDDYSMISNGFSAKLTEAGIFRSNDFRCWTKTGFMYIAKGAGTANAVFEQSQNASTCIHPVLKFPAD